MSYRVIAPFTDLHDRSYPYKEGDTFPRDGIIVTEERLVELSGTENKQKKPLIEQVLEGKIKDGADKKADEVPAGTKEDKAAEKAKPAKKKEEAETSKK